MSGQDRTAASSWESRWLVERPVEGRAHPEYWDGSGWTDDPWKALASRTKEASVGSAPAFIRSFPTAKVVSHGFEVSRGS